MLLLKLTKPILEANWKIFDAIKIINKPEIKKWLADNGATGEPRVLGSGGYGWVFRVGDKVVKLTKDELEAKNSEMIMSKCNHPNMVKVWAVRPSGYKITLNKFWSDNNRSHQEPRSADVYLILQDFVDTKKVDTDLALAADLVGGYFDVEPKSFTQDINDVIKGFLEYNANLRLSSGVLEKVKILINLVRDIYKTCGFRYQDLHHGNIGYAADGTLKMFDYGLSQFAD